MTLKEALLKNCIDILGERLQTVRCKLADIENSLTSETKSSAGDKHETGRAMLHLEREKVGQQLSEIQKLQIILSRINPKSKHKVIALGSVVETTKNNYFIATSSGELTYNGKTYFAISAHTPMARVLLGQSRGDFITFRSDNFEIKNVY